MDVSEQHAERAIMRKIWRRILPLAVLIIFCSVLDRFNLGFAAVTMNQDLGLSNAAFGVAAGFFAIGYALFGIPSTLALHRFGARRWISFTMVAWGLCSAATALVATAEELMIVRCLLGAAEAGLTPGIVLYFSYWFPSAYRGRVFATTFLIQPLTILIGGPMSSLLLAWDGWLGLAGWQWLFVVEALPTLILAAAVFWFLTDRPVNASWLSSDERQWLARQLAQEQAAAAATGKAETSIWRTFANTRVVLLAIAYAAIGTAGVGTIFFMGLMTRSMGFSATQTGYLAALPGAVAVLTLPLWGWWTDRAKQRELVAAAGCMLIAVGLAGTAMWLPSRWALLPMTLALVGFFSVVVPFWTLPSSFLTGANAAAGIALINVSGNVGNFTGPALLGFLSDRTHSYAPGAASLAAIAALAAVAVWAQIPRARHGRLHPDRQPV